MGAVGLLRRRRESEDRATASRSVARTTLQVLLLLFGAAVGLLLLYRVRDVLLLVVLAVFFAYLVAPLVRVVRRPFSARGRRFAVPLPIAIGVVYVAILGLLAVAVIVLLPVLSREITELGKEAPGYLARAREHWRAWQETYRMRTFPIWVREAVDKAGRQGVMAAETYVTSELLPLLGGWLSYLPGLVLVPILAFFLLKDARLLRHLGLRILSRSNPRLRAVAFLGELDETLTSYIRAQVTACVLVGAACTIAFLAFGVPYAVVLGVASGALEFIPLAGPLVIGLSAVGLAAFHSIGLAAGLLLFLVVLRVVQDYVVYPKIIGLGIRMHPLAVILAILCGAAVGGLMGVFLAVPAVAILTVTLRHVREHPAEVLEDPA